MSTKSSATARPARRLAVDVGVLHGARSSHVPSSARDALAGLLSQDTDHAQAAAPAVAPSHVLASRNAVAEQGGFAVGQVLEVPLTLLVEDPWNAREFYSAEEIDEMGASLAEQGQDVPLAVYEHEGQLRVFDGVKRLKGARSRGLGALRVEIKPAPPNDLAVYLASRRMNLERSAQSVLDDAVRWSTLLKNKVVASQTELAGLIGKSEATVSQVLAINHIPRAVLSYMRDRPRCTEQLTAYKIAQIFRSPEAGSEVNDDLVHRVRAIVDEIEDKQLNRQEVDRLIARRLGEPKSRARAQPATVRCFGKEGSLKIFPTKGQVEFRVSGLTAEQLQQVEKFIRGLEEHATAG